MEVFTCSQAVAPTAAGAAAETTAEESAAALRAAF